MSIFRYFVVFQIWYFWVFDKKKICFNTGICNIFNTFLEYFWICWVTFDYFVALLTVMGNFWVLGIINVIFATFVYYLESAACPMPSVGLPHLLTYNLKG